MPDHQNEEPELPYMNGVRNEKQHDHLPGETTESPRTSTPPPIGFDSTGARRTSSRPATANGTSSGTKPLSVHSQSYERKGPASDKSRILWRKVKTNMIARYRVQRMLESFRQSAGSLCEPCESLKLTESKFLISEYSKHRRPTRTAARTMNGLGPDGLDFGPHEHPLGTLKELYAKRESCPFCGLVVTSLNEQYKTFVHDSYHSYRTADHFYTAQVMCFVSWQIDGRVLIRDNQEKIIGDRPATRRIRLRWQVSRPSKIEELFDTYVVLVAPRNGGKGLFFGRPLHSVKTDAALIRRWIGFCETSHGDLCKPQTNSGPLPKSFFGVIDVSEMCLTKLPADGRYVALSYTWGKGDHHYVTKKENVRDRFKPGGIRKIEIMLPRTIKDAINLVRDLGEKYIWIDSLCIIQDSDRSWALNSRVMNLVYGNAYLTVCAADGESANAGLQVLNPARSEEKEQATNQNITQYNRDIRLMATQPAENYIRNCVWNTRGWTFQERLLSPRNLIFTGGRLFFQCRCTARSVDIISEDESAGFSIEFKDSPLLMLQKLKTRPLTVYKQALELYMTRELTNAKDILAAFTGIGNLVCDALGGNLIYGLPSSHFDWALLWEPRDAAVPRANEGGEKFPTWSWCGWKNEIMEYKDQMLAGCEDNLHNWLMKHTWITWYIRDGNGDLRLVWDGESKTLPPETDSTWRGYHLNHTFDEQTHDKYGRYVKDYGKERRNRIEDAEKFQLILDECPYGVDIIEKISPITEARSSSTERDMPFLQFKTWSAHFRIEEDFISEMGDDNNASQNERIFRRYSILDYKDDWCGTICLDKFWVKLEGRVPTRDLNVPLEFIALSDAKHFGEGEYGTWANYIPQTKKESSWDLYYVMLVETKSDISTRVGLGKVFKDAFDNSCKQEGKQWKEFILG